MRLDSEIFTLLNANGVSLDKIPGGGETLINPDTIRLAMRGSTRDEFALALYMAGEDREFSHVWAGLFAYAIETPEYDRLRTKQKHFLSDLCRMAIMEYCHRPLCPQCSGSGSNPAPDYSTCQNCKGVGIKPISNTQRAQVLNRSAKSFTPFQEVYSLLLQRLHRHQDRNERKLNKILK